MKKTVIITALIVAFLSCAGATGLVLRGSITQGDLPKLPAPDIVLQGEPDPDPRGPKPVPLGHSVSPYGVLVENGTTFQNAHCCGSDGTCSIKPEGVLCANGWEFPSGAECDQMCPHIDQSGKIDLGSCCVPGGPHDVNNGLHCIPDYSEAQDCFGQFLIQPFPSVDACEMECKFPDMPDDEVSLPGPDGPR